MFITKKHISRRALLRGAMGATVALPFLDSMVPALSAAPSSPFRFGAVYFPCGVWPDTWHPDKEGSDFAFKPVMQPLEPYRDQLVTISKMKAPWGSSVHLGASSAFLNGLGPGGSRGDSASGDAFGKIQSKKTIDQHIADKMPAIRRCGRSRWAPRTWAPPSAPAMASPAPSSTRSRGAT